MTGQIFPTLLLGGFAIAFFCAVMSGADVRTVGTILGAGIVIALIETVIDQNRH